MGAGRAHGREILPLASDPSHTRCGRPRLVRLPDRRWLAWRGGAQMSVVRIVPVVARRARGALPRRTARRAAARSKPPRTATAVAVSRLLDQGAAVDTRAVDGTTALHWAARADRLDTVRLLLESGADAQRRRPLRRDAALSRGRERQRRRHRGAARCRRRRECRSADRRDRIDDGRAHGRRRRRHAVARPRRRRRCARPRVRADGADARGARSASRGRRAVARARRGRRCAHARRPDAEFRSAVQRHGLRLRGRRHQSRRIAGPRPARRRVGRHDAAQLRRTRRAHRRKPSCCSRPAPTSSSPRRTACGRC